jgi:hypothetical protein
MSIVWWSTMAMQNSPFSAGIPQPPAMFEDMIEWQKLGI